MKGKIIVFEGIDGSGKQTQANELKKRLEEEGCDCELLHFPRYEETFFGREVARYLNGVYGGLNDLHPKLAAMLYAGDRFEKREFIADRLRRGTILIFDRYVSSNIAHQSAKLPASQYAEFKQWIETLEYSVYRLPRPDLTLFLDLPPELSQELILNKEKRSYTDKKQDIHEEDRAYLQAVYETYRRLSREERWAHIRCHENGAVLPVARIAEAVSRAVFAFLRGEAV
jgi:dTMP kinase